MNELQELTITNRRGLKLFTRIHKPPKCKAVIIAAHGLFAHQGNSDGKYYLLAKAGVQRGYTVVRFDFTGRGRSEGAFPESTLSARIDDLEDVVSEVRTLIDLESSARVLLVGGSMGGTVSLCWAARQPSQVAGVVTWAAPADMAWNLEQTNPALVAELQRLGTISLVDHGNNYTLTYEYYQDLKRNVPLKELHLTAGIPKLFIQGQADIEVLPCNAEMLYEAAPEPKELRFYPKADHRFSACAEELITDSLEWLDDHLDAR